MAFDLAPQSRAATTVVTVTIRTDPNAVNFDPKTAVITVSENVALNELIFDANATDRSPTVSIIPTVECSVEAC